MEIESLMQESIQNLENDFYSKPFSFSYSSLNKLMWNPQAFYQMYVLGNREEKTESYLVNGKVIHCLLLEEAKFNEQFIISLNNLPTGNSRVVVDRVFAHHQEIAASGDQRTELNEFSDAILDVMRDINYHQSLKTDQQRLDKIITTELTEYWNFLKTKGNKTLIDQETYDFCKTAVELIKTDKKVFSLLGLDVNDFSNKQVFNELPLEVNIMSKPFKLKGIIDNIVIDHTSKIIYVNDLKTSSKDLKDFTESVDFYNYWLQAAIYSSLIGIKFINLIEGGYQLVFHFVVVDRNFQTYPFLVKDTTLNGWLEKLSGVIEKAHWHYVNRSYDLPYDFAVGSVTL